MAEKLSAAIVEAATPRATRYTIWDSEVPGFGLRVEASGGRSFVVKYRAGAGGRSATQRLQTLGRFPLVKINDARAEAKRLVAGATLGKDPGKELAARRREMTVRQLIDLYEEHGLVVQRGLRIGTPMKPLTARYTMARLRHHVVPLLGPRRVSELNAGDIEAFAGAVARGKTAKERIGRTIVRGGEGAARKCVRDLSAVLSFAQRRQIIATNPVATASVRKTDGRRERFLTIEEVTRLGAALDSLEADGANTKATNIARLWALTGCRRNEIASLERTAVDLLRSLLVFDDTKTGRSIRPLAAPAAALLAGILEGREDRSPYVFPAERGDGFYTGYKRIWAQAVKRAGLPGVSPQTLRHSLGAAAASGGEGLLLVGAILGHANARSTQIYAHVDRDPARLAANRASAGFAVALGQKSAVAPPLAANDDALPVVGAGISG